MSSTEHYQAMASMMEFYDKLLNLELEEKALKISLPGDEVLNQWATGIPLIKCHPPFIDTLCFLQLMDKVKRLIVSYQPENEKVLTKIVGDLSTNVTLQNELVSNLVSLEENFILTVADELDVPVEHLLFLLNHTMKILIKHYAKNIIPYLKMQYWDTGICPVCGVPAHIARFDKTTGKRFLYCTMCDIEWDFKRLACPHCLNENQKDLQYFTLDGEEKYRIYTCEKCKWYVKTVDEQKASGKFVNMFQEDLQTIHLDLLARQKGYEVI